MIKASRPITKRISPQPRLLLVLTISFPTSAARCGFLQRWFRQDCADFQLPCLPWRTKSMASAGGKMQILVSLLSILSVKLQGIAASPFTALLPLLLPGYCQAIPGSRAVSLRSCSTFFHYPSFSSSIITSK